MSQIEADRQDLVFYLSPGTVAGQRTLQKHWLEAVLL